MHAGATQYPCFIHARVRIRRVATLVGAEAVLKLRVLRSSRDFDAYWDFHAAGVPAAPRPAIC